jgi:cytochrome P450
MLLVNILPAITAPKAHQARARLQAALGKYYGARKYEDEDASEIVRARAGPFVKHGVPGEEIGHIELALLHVSTANTIPTLYWFFVNIFNRSDLVDRLRDEVLPVIQKDGDDKAIIDVTILDEKCPLLVSCYREAIRLSNQAMGNRRVLEDTTVTDSKGNSYLLKKGENIQMSALVSHTLDAWGKDISAFKPDRFIETKDNTEAEKARRAAFIPFGGGRNLCPGRNFAFAENLGLVTCLLAGFDVILPDGPGLPVSTDCSFSQAAKKPANDGEGFGVKIQRRVGWEQVQWSFKS